MEKKEKIKTAKVTNHIFDKIPPNDLEIENTILGCIINNPKVFIRIAKFFSPDLFYNEKNNIIAQAIYNLNERNLPIDLLTVNKECLGLSKDVKSYDIVNLTNNKLSHNIETWFLILIEYYIRRRILSLCQEYQIKSIDMSEDALLLISNLASKIADISNMTIFNKSLNASEAVEKLINLIDTKFEAILKYRSVGFQAFDEYLYLDTGHIIMIAGSEGTGKSKLVMKFVKSLCLKYDDFACQYFSFEDSSVSIIQNWLADEVLISVNEMSNKGYQLTEKDRNIIKEYGDKIKQFDCEIINNTCRINDIKTSFINFCSQRPNKFNLLIIDNIMLLSDYDDNYKGNTTTLEDRIARKIKEISLETLQYNSAIIFLHHFSKDASTNKNRLLTGYQPEMTDFKGSSRFGDILTHGLLINRPYRHKELVACYPGYEQMLEKLTIIEIAKNRYGSTGFIRMFMDLKYNIFYVVNNNVTEEKEKKKTKKKQ